MGTNIGIVRGGDINDIIRKKFNIYMGISLTNGLQKKICENTFYGV